MYFGKSKIIVPNRQGPSKVGKNAEKTAVSDHH